jgi:hypothetical protein
LHRFQQFEPFYDRYLLRKPHKRYGVTAPIVIYQMGKVASTSLQHSLTTMGLDVPIYQLHFMGQLDEIETWVRDKRANAAPERLMLRRARYVANAIHSHEWKQVFMISLVRAPAQQLLSAFFQRPEVNMSAYRERLQRGEVSAQEVADYFLKYFRPGFPQEWFDKQLKEPFGIDVYATEFDRAKGYQFYEHDNIRLVVIRYEDLSRCVTEVMREFLGIPNFALAPANVGEEKKYGELYREVRRILRWTPERLDELHTTRYAQHFYTPQELEASVAR